MKEIKIKKGKFNPFSHQFTGKIYTALVDDEDFDYLNQFKWLAHTSPETTVVYAYRTIRLKNGSYTNLRMHIEIMQIHGFQTNGFVIHHKDENGLNNTKENLEITDHSTNRKNRTQRRLLAGRYWPVSK